MNKKLLRRIAAAATTLIIAAGSAATLAACTSDHPEVTVTYEFNGETYEVEYILYRHDAPHTVQHFIELADAGYYEAHDFVVHDFTDSYMMTGGYTVADGELQEVDYFTEIKELEKKLSDPFTQSVWMSAGSAENPKKGEGLYTVYGEAASKLKVEGAENTQTQGSLVMYYSDKGNFNGKVTVERHDGGTLQEEKYAADSATALFYTQLSASTPEGHSSENGKSKYCVFGKVKDWTAFNDGLLQAIKYYEDSLEEEESFTEETRETLNSFERFDELVKSKLDATFQAPISEPIYLRSVKVTKY